jgi:LEA14-like dessication related protein
MLKHISVLFLVFSLFTACETIDDLELIGSPRIKFYGVSKDGINLGLVLKIRNPNSYTFKVTQGKFKIWINRIEIGSAHLSDKIKIEPNSTAVYTFPVSASLKGKDLSLDLILDVIAGDSFRLKIDGKIKAGTHVVINHKFDVEWEERVGY